MTTKILALTDALGNLVRFELLPGHRFDTVGVAPLIDGVEFGALLADKAFDSNAEGLGFDVQRVYRGADVTALASTMKCGRANVLIASMDAARVVAITSGRKAR